MNHFFRAMCTISFLCIAAVGSPASASGEWLAAIASQLGGLGITFGVTSYSTDNPTGTGAVGLDLVDHKGAYCLVYRENAVANWAGESGFYGSCYKAAFLPGQSKRFDNLYLWAQNLTLPTPYRVPMIATYQSPNVPPAGYRCHLVLDYVPDICSWSGPWDFWFDMTTTTYFTLPAMVTTSPLTEGTRMHMDVYAPAVPEPSSLTALICGLVGVGGVVVRRRRQGR